jgi:hypothetical protein
MTNCHHDLTGCEFPCAFCRRGCHEHAHAAPHAGIGHGCPGFTDTDPTDAEMALANEAVRLFRESDGWGVSLETPYDPGNFVVVCRDPKKHDATVVAESMRNILAEILAEARVRSAPHQAIRATEEIHSSLANELRRLRALEERVHDHVRYMHQRADLSEGQIAHLLGVDRVTAREILQTPNPCGMQGPNGVTCDRERTHAPGWHWGPVDDNGSRMIWKIDESGAMWTVRARAAIDAWLAGTPAEDDALVHWIRTGALPNGQQGSAEDLRAAITRGEP